MTLSSLLTSLMLIFQNIQNVPIYYVDNQETSTVSSYSKSYQEIPQFTPFSRFIPNSRDTTWNRNLKQYCGKAGKSVSFKIVGGDNAELHAWPWLAAFFIDNDFSYVHCGGALITDRYVLTAAHCFFDLSNFKLLSARSLKVRLGEHDIKKSQAGVTQYDVTKLILHPKFSLKTSYSDVGLAKLSRPVKFSYRVSPICLPDAVEWGYISLTGTMPYIAGWGRIHNSGPQSSVLKEAQVQVTSNEYCRNAYTYATEFHLCAGFEEGGTDACENDSGGPLMLADASNRYFIIGIISTGDQCAKPGKPGVYTRVTSFVDWIKANAHIR